MLGRIAVGQVKCMFPPFASGFRYFLLMFTNSCIICGRSTSYDSTANQKMHLGIFSKIHADALLSSL